MVRIWSSLKFAFRNRSLKYIPMKQSDVDGVSSKFLEVFGRFHVAYWSSPKSLNFCQSKTGIKLWVPPNATYLNPLVLGRERTISTLISRWTHRSGPTFLWSFTLCPLFNYNPITHLRATTTPTGDLFPPPTHLSPTVP
jgi:hypothetical protein